LQFNQPFQPQLMVMKNPLGKSTPVTVDARDMVLQG
jgi:hypothetical protein